MDEQQFQTEETVLELRDIIKILKKRWILIISFFTVSVVVTAIVSLNLPKTYEAETTLRIKQSKGLAGSLLGSMPMANSLGIQQQMSTYAKILTSRTVIESVISQIYAGQPEKEIPDYETMLQKITTGTVKDTELLNVAVQDNSPLRAKKLANALVNTLMERMTYLSRSEQSMVRKFIGERLVEAKKELKRAEDELEAYKRDQRIAVPEEETKALVDQLAAINKLAAENQVESASAQAKLDSARKQLTAEKPGFVAINEVILEYQKKLAQLEVQLVGLLQKYTEKHPEVLAVRASIAETKQRLNSEISRVIRSEAPSMNPIHQGLLQGKIQVEAELAAAGAQKAAIEQLTDAQEQQLSNLPAKEQGLVRVIRDVDVTQQIYIMLAQRYEEARISEVMQPTDIQVIDVAEIPDADKPIKPKKTLNVLIAAFLGLFIGTGLAFVLEYINKTIDTIEDIQNYLSLSVLGSIPEFNGKGDEKSGRKHEI